MFGSRKYHQLVKELIKKYPYLFTKIDDQVWKEWVDFTKRDTNSLYEIVSGEFRTSIKARALFILFAPNYECIPFYWSVEESKKFIPNSDYYFRLVNTDLLPMFVEMILVFQQLTDATSDDGATWAKSAYNSVIFYLLKNSEEQYKEIVFEHYDLRDAFVFANMDEASGYRPFEQLLCSNEVPEYYKRKADERMRKIVTAEIDGSMVSRVDHEEALSQYQKIVVFCTFGNLKYSRDLFVSQIEFMLSYSGTGKLKKFLAHEVPSILSLLRGDENQELRYKFVCFVILTDPNNFDQYRVYNNDTENAAVAMLNEFGEKNRELAEKLRDMLSNWDDIKLKNQANLTERTSQNSALLQKMK